MRHRLAGEEAEQAGAMRHDGLAEVAVGHAHVHRLADGEVIGAFVHQVRHADQDFCTLLMVHAAPGTILEGPQRRFDGCIRVGGRGLGDRRDRRLGGRVGGRHDRAIRGVSPGAADQQLAGGNLFTRGDCVQRHGSLLTMRATVQRDLRGWAMNNNSD